MKQNIQPITIELDVLEILSVSVDLTKDAWVFCEVKNSEGIKKSYSLRMDNAIYSQWGSDDAFVLSWAMNELGLSPA